MRAAPGRRHRGAYEAASFGWRLVVTVTGHRARLGPCGAIGSCRTRHSCSPWMPKRSISPVFYSWSCPHRRGGCRSADGGVSSSGRRTTPYRTPASGLRADPKDGYHVRVDVVSPNPRPAPRSRGGDTGLSKTDPSSGPRGTDRPVKCSFPANEGTVTMGCSSRSRVAGVTRVASCAEKWRFATISTACGLVVVGSGAYSEVIRG